MGPPVEQGPLYCPCGNLASGPPPYTASDPFLQECTGDCYRLLVCVPLRTHAKMVTPKG